MRLVCLSDTHNRHDQIAVPDGDAVIHCGDATLRGTEPEISAFARWFRGLPHRHKLFVAGNHDWLFEREPDRARELLGEGIVYLLDSGTRLGELSVWGSPWTPWFLDWAFNLQRGAPLREKWERIPDATDVLLTHGPPRGIRDAVPRPGQAEPELTGCEDLLAAVDRIRPRLHVFGHIHEGYGRQQRGDTLHVNAAVCDPGYRAAHPPVVVDL